MSSSKQNDILWVFYFEGEKHQNRFYAFVSSIYIVSKEKIVCTLDVS